MMELWSFVILSGVVYALLSSVVLLIVAGSKVKKVGVALTAVVLSFVFALVLWILSVSPKFVGYFVK